MSLLELFIVTKERTDCAHIGACGQIINLNLCLLKAGVDPDEIGIIAPYRSQVFLIRSRLTQGQGHWRSKVEVNTVDQYQGRDKAVIIISFVRSSKDQENLVICMIFFSNFQLTRDNGQVGSMFEFVKNLIFISSLFV